MKEGLYIQLFSVHGLLRHENMEMGRDADTGGQIKYVVELARAVSARKEVRRVDLFTRLIEDKSVSSDYSIPIEEINPKFRIVRIGCGGRKYIRKELLWPHLDEYVDKTLKFIKRENMFPDIVHGHYPDAGYVALQLSEFFGVPFVFTGHSLGRSKYAKLINEGMTRDEIIKKYKMDRRIAVEEKVLALADLIVTSTNQEKKEQYGQYNNHAIPPYAVIPPGIDIETFYPFYHDMHPEHQTTDELAIRAYSSVTEELNRFVLHPEKPVILALCRPDKRKNISGLIRAYGEDLELQAIANLAVFAGIRKRISEKEDNEKDVLTEMLLLMDNYDLYGKMAIPKKHDFEYEVPELYRIVGEKKGVFVNVALTEPFGLTLLEASACGVPIVATNDGGPRDIIKNCKNGVVVDPSDTSSIAREIKKILTHGELWKTYSKNGIINVRKHYTWEAHVDAYLAHIHKLHSGVKENVFSMSMLSSGVGKRLAKLNNFLITDIDNTLIGDDNSHLDELISVIKKKRDVLGFGIATGRSVDSAMSYLEEYGVPEPDVLIASVGSEIFYNGATMYDYGWDTHISNKWDRKKIVHILKELPFLEYQEDEVQKKHKISYFMEANDNYIPAIHDLLLKNKCKYRLIYSHNQFLDILPYRASKGKAIRYLGYKWEIPLDNIITCGDSGNDEEMLRGEMPGIVVGNYSSELEKLKGLHKIYFSGASCSGGIVEGLRYYNFLNNPENN